MPTSKPGIQVKTYNLEPDLGLQSPDWQGSSQWGFAQNEGSGVLETFNNQSLGVADVLSPAPPTPQVFWGPSSGLEVEEGNDYFDLGLNFVLGAEVVGGPADETLWVWGLEPLPEPVVEPAHFLIGTEFGEYIATHAGELIEIT